MTIETSVLALGRRRVPAPKPWSPLGLQQNPRWCIAITIGKLLDGERWCCRWLRRSARRFLTSAISRRRVSIDTRGRKVDGAHAVLKTLLREIMAMLDNGGERKPVIGAETHVEGERSFAAARHASAVKHLSTCRCDTFGMNKKRCQWQV